MANPQPTPRRVQPRANQPWQPNRARCRARRICIQPNQPCPIAPKRQHHRLPARSPRPFALLGKPATHRHRRHHQQPQQPAVSQARRQIQRQRKRLHLFRQPENQRCMARARLHRRKQQARNRQPSPQQHLQYQHHQTRQPLWRHQTHRHQRCLHRPQPPQPAHRHTRRRSSPMARQRTAQRRNQPRPQHPQPRARQPRHQRQIRTCLAQRRRLAAQQAQIHQHPNHPPRHAPLRQRNGRQPEICPPRQLANPTARAV